MDGFLGREQKAQARGGLIVMPAVKIKKPAKKPVNPAGEEKEKKEQNIHLAGQSQAIAAPAERAENGAKKRSLLK